MVKNFNIKTLPTYAFTLCSWAENTWPAVGVVDTRGQQNAQFVVLVARIQLFEARQAGFSPFLTA